MYELTNDAIQSTQTTINDKAFVVPILHGSAIGFSFSISSSIMSTVAVNHNTNISNMGANPKNNLQIFKVYFEYSYALPRNDTSARNDNTMYNAHFNKKCGI